MLMLYDLVYDTIQIHQPQERLDQIVLNGIYVCRYIQIHQPQERLDVSRRCITGDVGNLDPLASGEARPDHVKTICTRDIIQIHQPQEWLDNNISKAFYFLYYLDPLASGEARRQTNPLRHTPRQDLDPLASGEARRIQIWNLDGHLIFRSTSLRRGQTDDLNRLWTKGKHLDPLASGEARPIYFNRDKRN